MTYACKGRTASDLLPALAKFILENGDETGSRNGRVMEILNTQIEISEPTKREILTEGRKANIFAQIAETMWVIGGRNDVEWLSEYLPRAKDYSDDGTTWRGGYGPRLRCWPTGIVLGSHGLRDQLAHVVELLKEDPLSRRAVIAIYDPETDMLPGKDIPCNDFLQFQSRLGKLHMTVTVRSNDLFWGWSGINAFEWSTVQEIVASLLGVQVGTLTFNIGNLHIYEQHWKRARGLRNVGHNGFVYEFNPTGQIKSMADVDNLIGQWFRWEDRCRKGAIEVEDLKEWSHPTFGDTTCPLFAAWACVIAYYWTGDDAWLDRVKGSALEEAVKKVPQSVLRPSPSKAGQPTPGDGLSDRSEAFYDFVSNLHATKHKSYGDSWKKRGEKMSILANIARKVDRLGADDQFESEADTVIDLWVYLAKYLHWLNGGDSGPDFVNAMLHEELSKFDDLGTGDRASLKHIEWLMNEYMDLVAHSTVADRYKRDFVRDVMAKVLPIAVDLWDKENPFWDGTEMTDEYRGADVD